jgi:hypothetical protein
MFQQSTSVIARLDPAIPISVAQRCSLERVGRVKSGHDDSVKTDQL